MQKYFIVREKVKKIQKEIFPAIGDELMDDARTTEGFMSMKGGGYYSKATIGAKHVIDNAAHLIFDSLGENEP